MCIFIVTYRFKVTKLQNVLVLQKFLNYYSTSLLKLDQKLFGVKKSICLAGISKYVIFHFSIDVWRPKSSVRRVFFFFTILNIYEDQNDYQLKQKNGLDFSNFAPTSIINSNSYTLLPAKDESFSSSFFTTTIFLASLRNFGVCLPKKQD